MKIVAVSLETVHTHTHTICLANKKIDINYKKDSDTNL